jgi:hypothetical protein
MNECHFSYSQKKWKKKRKRKRTTGAVSDFFGGRFFMKNILQKDYSITHSKYFQRNRKTREDFIKLQNHQKSPQLPII